MKNTIVELIKDSAAERAGMKTGEELLKMNGHDVVDVIDYQYFSSMKRVRMLTADETGKKHRYLLRKPTWENIGLVFEDALMDEIRSCRNACIFCFIAQMPPKMRKTLYVRDDDWRLSLMMGNYITLTNVDEAEFRRIIERKTSPLYISVHATDGDVRSGMMRNPDAADILPRLRRLAENGISFHCQVVLCPGWNDGAVLEKTMEDLFALYPAAQSMAVVPVGLTKYRENLTEIPAVSREKAREIIAQTEAFAKKALEQTGTRFVFASDEMYMAAELPLPADEYYEAYDQIDNGVGLCSQLVERYRAAEEEFGPRPVAGHPTIATGKSAENFLRKLIADENVDVIAIKNRFFGESITVAGLVTGGDLIEQLSERSLGDRLLIPSCMLRSEGDLFLDDVPFTDVEKKLGVPTKAICVDGRALYCELHGIKEEDWKE